jgi:hypothetical protein
MIDPDAEPIAHVSPYRRIDPRHPGRKAVITRQEIFLSGSREPDAAIYHYDYVRRHWILKEGV